ncbi:hypothetical protein NBRC10512_006719 [Rhodotorula toruloides]|uniref:RHTO0S30e00672g1_1 n=2 Tax=Rhodotorula toruloides TaxID=5286 RepID=A0A061BJY6_RHOTO|nr:uncharacterized protein RHTO_00014 [Rhodotorula toruloides NP11]EMS25586.1 hypothetical protein RHTO_00014 [Rhodotorula toruloides NP11]KAJ8296176.1 hypothetical protein OF846_001480 [Rhodotorula toruloides]CDR49707.1 RHTO0S30e00672g1_1 [Rhodotorula toruloides]
MAGTAIHDLPEELLAEILSHFASEQHDVDFDTLKACALVHSSWRDSAHKIICEAGVELETEADVAQWTRTRRLRRYAPKELSVRAYKSRTALGKLLDGCDGLRWLMLATPTRNFDPAVLAHPALSDLRTLILQGEILRAPLDLVYPFRLRSLVVADTAFRSPHLASFLDTIAKTSSNTLKTLSLSGFSSNAHPAVACSLLSFASSLTHLGLSLASSDPSDPYHPLLASCTTLESFECTSLPASLLSHLPPTLAGLATTEDAPCIPISALAAALERLKGIKRLYFACLREDFCLLPGAAKLVNETEARGVKWWFADDRD